MNWKIGQKLVSLKDVKSHLNGRGPSKGDIVTYDGIDPFGFVYLKEHNFLNINGVRYAVGAHTVRPLLGDSAKSELISSFKEVTETSDCPIRQPQTETA